MMSYIGLEESARACDETGFDASSSPGSVGYLSYPMLIEPTINIYHIPCL